MKVCSTCKILKKETEFHKNRSTKDGLHNVCKKCSCNYSLIYKRKHPETRIKYNLEHREEIQKYSQKYRYEHQEEMKIANRKNNLKLNFGMTVFEYDKLFMKQKGLCAICGRPQSVLKKMFAVDHDHSTGENRGLLCEKCNLGIGHFKDNSVLLRRAAEYIENFRRIYVG